MSVPAFSFLFSGYSSISFYFHFPNAVVFIEPALNETVGRRPCRQANAVKNSMILGFIRRLVGNVGAVAIPKNVDGVMNLEFFGTAPCAFKNLGLSFIS